MMASRCRALRACVHCAAVHDSVPVLRRATAAAQEGAARSRCLLYASP
ncbi:Uncharacterized protein pbN1_38400 [Aromatoleum bremense]|nr:Uncharacterized protein pbN1_38400 [Aromatoleum bremense]